MALLRRLRGAKQSEEAPRIESDESFLLDQDYQTTQEGGRWYPGKGVVERIAAHKERKQMLAAGEDYVEPKSGFISSGWGVRNRWKKKRELGVTRLDSPIGKLNVSVDGLHTEITNRPYVILAVDGNEGRTSTSKVSEPTWKDTPFEFMVESVESQLSIFVFDGMWL